ncbi:MAG: CobW family GTP-binding protein [Hyphomicrobiaceae bacterium]
MGIPVTVIGGYLGAGKTTLINHVLTASHGLRIAVLVNDFGSVNIDASLIADAADDTISLTNGCVCCSIHDDLGSALDLQTRRAAPPDHIVIETSGVAEPARILTYATAWPGIRLDAVVTLVDAETIRARADDKFVGRVVRRQLAAADFLVVNKQDLVTDADRHDLSQWLADQAPMARPIHATHANVDPALLFETAQLKRPNRAMKDSGDNQHGATFVSAKVELPSPTDIDALADVLSQLPGTIHRVKGFVRDRATGQWMLVQRVANRQSITVSADLASKHVSSTLVAIGTSDPDLRAIACALSVLQRSV